MQPRRRLTLANRTRRPWRGPRLAWRPLIRMDSLRSGAAQACRGNDPPTTDRRRRPGAPSGAGGSAVSGFESSPLSRRGCAVGNGGRSNSLSSLYTVIGSTYEGLWLVSRRSPSSFWRRSNWPRHGGAPGAWRLARYRRYHHGVQTCPTCPCQGWSPPALQGYRRALYTSGNFMACYVRYAGWMIVCPLDPPRGVGRHSGFPGAYRLIRLGIAYCAVG